MMTPRLRMFAGPNGSGKSTIKDALPAQLLGVYINADDMEQSIRRDGYLDLAAFSVDTSADEILGFFLQSSFLASAGLLDGAGRLRFHGGRLHFEAVEVNSYFASVAGDFIRHKLLAAKTSCTFETVMSGPDKVAFLRKAQQAGFRTYLYYVATEDPQINVSRVLHRVKVGGHPVPEDKIISRYYRSLELLLEAVSYSDKAYIFDNSGRQQVQVAEVSDGEMLEMKTEQMPNWFKTALWDKFEVEDGEI
ncbi:putative ABC-type ATPase [Oxalobacteraceae bacterium GrIS 1.11]